MEIKASDIKALRDSTGAGLMDCKKALTACNGDIAEAEKQLREKGLAAMSKRSDRATGEGRIFIKQDDKKIAMAEVTCETDFVAKNSDFIAVGEKIVAEVFDNCSAIASLLVLNLLCDHLMLSSVHISIK